MHRPVGKSPGCEALDFPLQVYWKDELDLLGGSKVDSCRIFAQLMYTASNADGFHHI